MQAVAHQVEETIPSDWAEIWLGVDPTPRMVVDWGLTLLWRNAAADSMLESTRLLHARDGALVCKDRVGASQIQNMVWNVKPSRPVSAVLGEPDDHGFLVTGTLLRRAGTAYVGLTFRELEIDFRYELPDLEPVFGLTPSEQEIVGLLLAGQSSAEIARKLDKSILTVRTHVKRAYGKLGICSKEQLFAKLLRYGTIW